ncbi:hypothetical protein P2W49_04275 [Yersinia intermedia]|nr:hypothetical protein P2W49_04275 [Yersinia intermedia]
MSIGLGAGGVAFLGLVVIVVAAGWMLPGGVDLVVSAMLSFLLE